MPNYTGSTHGLESDKVRAKVVVMFNERFGIPGKLGNQTIIADILKDPESFDTPESLYLALMKRDLPDFENELADQIKTYLMQYP